MKYYLLLCAWILSGMFFVAQAQAADAPRERKAIIIYFSQTNNTRAMAEFIGEHSGFDIEEIKLVQPYAADYRELVKRAEDEYRRGYLPPLQPLQANLDDYDMILVGSPLWVDTLSLPVMSFLTEHDLSGKTVVPFCTRGTSPAGPLFAKVAELSPNSRVLKGFDITRGEYDDSLPALREWTKNVVAELSK